MKGLAAAQAALADLVRTPSTLVGTGDAEQVATRLARGSERLSPVEQIDVYREQFFLRHVGALREDFESIAQLLGGDGFDALARAYLAAHPPSSCSLRDLGHTMADFVTRTPPWSEDLLVADVARVEWAFVEAFDGPDAPPLDPNVIANAAEEAWPGARIVLHPSLRRLSLAYPAHDYRQAARKGEAVARPAPKATFVVIHRGPERLQYTAVDADAFAMLDELARGATLSVACERVAASTNVPLDAFESKLGEWFQRWTAAGWIAAVRFDP